MSKSDNSTLQTALAMVTFHKKAALKIRNILPKVPRDSMCAFH